MTGFIPPEQYKELLELMPIPCVDIVVRHKGQFLMVKRKNPPVQGQWWLPGGRIFKGETIVQAAFRKLKEETNLEGATIVKTLGPYETMFDDGPFGVKTGVHSINVVVLVDVDDISGIVFDKDHSGATWFGAMSDDWHPYIKQVLKDCGFK